MTPYNHLADIPHWRCSKCQGLNSSVRPECLECGLVKPKNPQYRHKDKKQGRLQERE